MGDLDNAIDLLTQIGGDTYVPKNIRDVCKRALERLNNESEKVHIRIGATITMLDELSQDPNLPFNTRTHIWEIASLLETCSKEMKS